MRRGEWEGTSSRSLCMGSGRSHVVAGVAANANPPRGNVVSVFYPRALESVMCPRLATWAGYCAHTPVVLAVASRARVGGGAGICFYVAG